MGTVPGRFLVWLAIGIAAIAAFHFFALYHYLYWKLPWLDDVMHFTGGVWAAGLFLWARSRFPAYFGETAKPAGLVLQTLAFVALVGVLWELYEFIVYLFFGKDTGVGKLFGQLTIADTMSDLLSDLLGGFAAALLFLRYRGKERSAPPSRR